jgi:hypothetical protein
MRTVKASLISIVRCGLVVGFVGTVGLAGPAAADPNPIVPGVYGDPVAAEPYWQPQLADDSCGLMAVADVVGQVTGDLPTEHEMVDLAEHTPSVSQPGPIYVDPDAPGGGEGISYGDLVALLSHFGVPSKATYSQEADQIGLPTGLPALEQYLGQGRKIIAFVNSAIIWKDSDEQHDSSDHFLVVTGVDINDNSVHLNDSGAEDDGANEQVPVDTFLAAWDTGDETMIVTDAA